RYVPTTSGQYFVRVAGTTSAAYDLVVTRNAAFEVEANDVQATAQDIGGTRGVLGAIATATDADWYKLTLGANQTSIQLATRTPASGPGEFVNTLDPQIQLFNSAGSPLAAGSTLPDGRNETLQVTGLSPGTYVVRIGSQGGTKGEYFLAVNTPGAPLLTA